MAPTRQCAVKHLRFLFSFPEALVLTLIYAQAFLHSLNGIKDPFL